MGITAIPMLYSLYLSFTNYELLSQSSDWIGFDNYKEMFTNDPQFRHADRVTLVFALVAWRLAIRFMARKLID